MNRGRRAFLRNRLMVSGPVASPTAWVLPLARQADVGNVTGYDHNV